MLLFGKVAKPAGEGQQTFFFLNAQTYIPRGFSTRIMLMIIFKGVKAAADNIRGTTRGHEKCRLMHHQQAANT